MKKTYPEDFRIYLRFADFEDAEDLLKWRNDENTRNASFNTKEINVEEHKKWFKESLRNPERNIFIICDMNCHKLGQIRFDKIGDSAEIDITIDTDFRHQGIGSIALKKASKCYMDNFHVDRLIGKVKTDNIASMKTFENAGFIVSNELDEYVEFRYER